MSATDDFNIMVTDQHRELTAAMSAETDHDLAFCLQMEEAIAASISTLPPSDRPSPSAAPSSSSSSLPLAPSASARRVGDAGQSLAHAIHLQALELDRYQLETRDRLQSLAEVRMSVEDIRRQAHDDRFAREILEIPDDEWDDYGDEFERPIEAAGVSDEGNFRLYFKGRHHVSEGSLITFDVVAATICDCNDKIVLEIQKPIASDLAACREVLEAMALLEGLNAVISLGIKKLDVFFDYRTLFNHVKGTWGLKRMKISNVINEVQALIRKLEVCEMFLVARCHMQPVFRLISDAIHSQTSKNVVDPVDQIMKETCNICFEVLDSSEMFSIEECSHRFCLSCMKQHVEVKLLNGILPSCPHDGCKVMLDKEGARKFLPPRLLELMNLHLKEASIPATEKVYCPYPKCSALMSKSEVISPPQQASSSKQLRGLASGLRKCIKCNRSFCINCKVPWHERQSCYQFSRLHPNFHPEEAKLKSLAKQNLWRQCVKCNHMIELSEGCFHMTCRCGYEFCYTCGAAWKDKNPTCKCPLFEYTTEGDELYDEEDYVDSDEYSDDDF